MSPTTTFSPSTPATSIKVEGPVTASSATSGAMTAAINGLRGTNRVYPHLDDLVGVTPEISIHAPIRKILQEGELFAKQADTHLDFRRPDVALQEHIKALIVATDIVPRHKDYPSLQSDRGDLHRLYTGLKKRINGQYQRFADVKDLIKENNAQSGVQPKATHTQPTASRDSPLGSGHARSQSMQSPATSNSATSFSNSAHLNGMSKHQPPLTSTGLVRQKPIVHRKPDALLGNALQPSDGKSAGSTQGDLAARFARLRGNDSSVPVQDPRIRTRPISIPESANGSSNVTAVSQDSPAPSKNILRPAGPREMPAAPDGPPRPAKMKLPIDVNLPAMPRPPDAIYSPARSADSETTVSFPASTPRASHIRKGSRQNSSSSLTKVVRTLPSADEPREYFSAAHPSDGYTYTAPQRTAQRPTFPDNRTSITPNELFQLNEKCRILLVDIRTRSEFDRGHIMSQSIVCVEPMTVRADVSAQQLEESMVLAPDVEQELFKDRHQFDLIVFYNQASSDISSYDRSTDTYKHVLRDFQTVVFEYGYLKKPKHIPVLLLGGLDAWMELMGPNCLQSSRHPTSIAGSSQIRQQRPLSRYITPQDSYRTAAERKKKFESRLLSAEEEKKWDDVLREEQPGANDDTDNASYARTTEDFFRRFPPVSMESMVSPANETFKQQRFEDESQRELASTAPAPPARPPPALPRQSFSGVSQKGQVHMMAAQSPSISNTIVLPGLTGLHNFGNTCYMNAALQCLSATRLLREYLIRFHYPPQDLPPMKSGELSVPPQLMVRNLGNLLRYLWSGQYSYVTPKTFRDYVRRLHGIRRQRPDNTLLGGNSQQDSMEFLNYILENLNDELNPKRNAPMPPPYTAAEDAARSKQPLLHCAIQDWQRRLQYESSPINNYFQVTTTDSYTCSSCGYTSVNPDSTMAMILPMENRGDTLGGLLTKTFQATPISGKNCDGCKKQETAQKRTRLARLPPYLIVQLGRFTSDQYGSAGKNQNRVDFPIEGLDLTPYSVWNTSNPGERAILEGDSNMSGLRGPFHYRLYAVLEHRGSTLESGHYLAHTRDEDLKNSTWHLFNDPTVTEARILDNSLQSRAYVLFYKRM
ncbi:Ubiquitin carboxyl-terminal hydrolase 4 [Phlyctema vagabunda]|uniref:Ubiquitin carboxyl-terminal hydrolase 4 n=1 Tax=Phlyctema vagabunda TaxID=108571 RepID=A0ABR4PEU6_9HELO